MSGQQQGNRFDLGDYVEVKDRIKVFYELFGRGALVTEQVEILTDPTGKQRVMVKALAYRTPDDPHPGVGHSWLELPGNTPYTKGSEVENAETSAWGRAIGSLGILIDRSIASRNEVDAKAGGQERADAPGSLIGTIDRAPQAPWDMELRQTPDGTAYGFKLTAGRQNVRVTATGPLADALAALGDSILGKRATCYGKVTPDEWVVNKGTPSEKKIPYSILALSRIETAEFTLPAGTPDAAGADNAAEAPQNPASDPEIDALPMFGNAA